MLKLKRWKLVLCGATLFVTVGFAAEHFLVAFNMTVDQDASTEYASAQAFFGQAQTALNPKGQWRAGDTFTVQYNDAKVSFTLSNRGLTCNGIPSFSSTVCRFATTVPFDTPPKVIQAKHSNGGAPITLTVAGDQTINTVPGPNPVLYPNQVPVIDLNGVTPTYKFTLTSGNTTWTNGVMTQGTGNCCTSGGGGGGGGGDPGVPRQEQ